MTCFISGGAKNGKTSLAQDIVVNLAKEGKRYYVATMIPSDDEDRERIRLHIEDREGMGFETIECGRDILSALDHADRKGTFLLDSVTALLMNELFPPERNYEMDLEAANRCEQALVDFLSSVQHAVIVSDSLHADAIRYDSATETFRRGLAQIDRRLAKICDVVLEMSAGLTIVHKGELPL